jgi:hypothetical protein
MDRIETFAMKVHYFAYGSNMSTAKADKKPCKRPPSSSVDQPELF